jgi:hypothetical protein
VGTHSHWSTGVVAIATLQEFDENNRFVIYNFCNM